MTPVRVQSVVDATDPLPIVVAGVLAEAKTARLSFKTGGPIAQILVDEGQLVRRGQVLARLRGDEIDASVDQAGAALAKARRDAERLRRLYADSVVTLAQLEDAETGLAIADAGHRAAVFNQGFSEMVAPLDGRVLRRWAEPNELVAPGAPVLELGLAGGWVVRAGLADVDLVRVSIGDRVGLAFDAFPGETFEGRVSSVAAVADMRIGTFAVEITVSRSDPRLRSGFVARAEIFPTTGTSALRVPSEALVRAVGRDGVIFVVDEAGTTAREKTIRIERILDRALAVSSGVAVGDRVVTDGAAYLRDGDAVRIVE